MFKSPFKFLDSYTREDREIFFGREKEITELYRKVFESRILLVYGMSGTGKSSLIHCGLAGKFKESDWLPVVVRRSKDMNISMASELMQLAVTPIKKKPQTPSDFTRAVKSIYLDMFKPVFFIFDQFEELFIFGSKEEQDQFISILNALLVSDVQCRFLFILREEYLAHLSSFEKAIHGFFSNRMRIEKMSHENALQAIDGPCKFAGISLEPGFGEKLLEKLCPNENEVELTYLQVFLDKLFKQAQNKGQETSVITFSHSLLEAAGNVTDILGGFLDEQITLQAEPETAMTVLKAFVSSRGTRQPMDPGEVQEYALSIGKEVNMEALSNLLLTFVNLRILQDKDQHGKYELRHDALAAKIFEKFTVGERELLEVKRYVENAYQIFETRGTYLNKDDLSYLDVYTGKLLLASTLDSFVKTSRQRLMAQQRAISRLSKISAVLFILIVAGIVMYYIRTRKGNENRDLINLAVFQSASAPLQSLSTAMKAWEMDSSSTVLQYVIFKDIQQILNAPPDNSGKLNSLQEKYQPVPLPAPVQHAEISRKGTCIYGWSNNGFIFIWEIVSKKRHTFPGNEDILAMELDENKSLVARIYKDGTCLVSDYDGRLRFSVHSTPNRLMNDRLLAFFPGGPYCLAVVKNTDARIYDSIGKLMFELKGHPDRINSLDISPDGKFVATAGCDKQVMIWNYNNQARSFSPYDTLLGHRDTVWSCTFSRSGLYVLTASADTTTRIWDLNGNDINPGMIFGRLYQKVDHYKYSNISGDEDSRNPDLANYYKKACNATFSTDEKAVIMTGYDWNKTGIPEYNQAIFVDEYCSDIIQKITDLNIRQLYYLEDTILPEPFISATVACGGKVAAVVKRDSLQIQLFSPNGFNIAAVPGTMPMFSPDGFNLFWIQGDRICSMPVNPHEMNCLFSPDSINENRKAKDIWTVL